MRLGTRRSPRPTCRSTWRSATYAAGDTLIVQGKAHFNGQPNPVPFLVTRKVVATRAGAMQLGQPERPIHHSDARQSARARHASILSETGDIRDYALSRSEAARRSRCGRCRALAGGGFSQRHQRAALLRHRDRSAGARRPAAASCTRRRAQRRSRLHQRGERLPCRICQRRRCGRVSFDRAPAPFTRSDFDETKPTVTVFGNLADASQGKAEREAVLGNGDNRQIWQTFPLPKSPLTYFLSSDGIPPQTPELEIWVGGRLWSRVDTFFGRGPKEEIYIVREDAEGRSFVQFGDGETGTRPALGRQERQRHLPHRRRRPRADQARCHAVRQRAAQRASTRSRSPASSLAAPIAKISTRRVRQRRARCRASAAWSAFATTRPRRSAIPGVVTATAAWDLHDGVPAVILRVLLEAGREAEFAQVRAVIAHAQRCHGPDRFPVVVEQAFMRYAFLDVVYARDSTFKREDVEAAMRAALGLVGDVANERTGLFGLRARRLGEREYASRIEGRLQNVAGVLWCQVTALGRFAAGHHRCDDAACCRRRRVRCWPRCPARRTSCCSSRPRISR